MARPPSSSRETARSAIRKLSTESAIDVAKSSVRAVEGRERLDLADCLEDLVLSHLAPHSSALTHRPSAFLRRPCPSVTSSAYSRSPPTGSPLASRVIRSPNSLSIRVR